MPRFTLSVVLVLVFFALVGSSFAQTSVWQVSNGDHTLYLAGTVHVLASSDYPLPEEFDAVFNKADIVYLEADISQLNDQRVQADIARNTVYPQGQSIADVLRPETMAALKEYLGKQNVPQEQFYRFKAGMLSITLPMLEIQRLGEIGTGVDAYYSLKAQQEGKPLAYLETVQEQLDMLYTLGAGYEDELISYTLKELGSMEQNLAEIKQYWRTGDMPSLAASEITPLLSRFPAAYRSLLGDRNDRWVVQIEQLLTTDETELVMVGTLHFAGPDGLLAQLKARGYQIKTL